MYRVLGTISLACRLEKSLELTIRPVRSSVFSWRDTGRKKCIETSIQIRACYRSHKFTRTDGGFFSYNSLLVPSYIAVSSSVFIWRGSGKEKCIENRGVDDSSSLKASTISPCVLDTNLYLLSQFQIHSNWRGYSSFLYVFSWIIPRRQFECFYLTR